MELNFNQAKKYVKQELENYLKAKGINTHRPFRCLNPHHEDKNPSMCIDRSSNSGPHCKCFSCDAYYDTFDLIRLDTNITNDSELFAEAFRFFSLEVSDMNNLKSEHNFNLNTTDEGGKILKRNVNQNIMDKNKSSDSMIDFSLEVKNAHEYLLSNKDSMAHFQVRGLSLDTIKKYKLGYSEKGLNFLLKDYKENQSNSRKEVFYKYVFPYPDLDGRYTYFLTEISDRSKIDKYNQKYNKIKKMPSRIFNDRYLKQDEVPEVIFICEGIYDALSVEEVGGFAIAFVGVAHNMFLSICKEYKPKTTFVISLDNDMAGQQATEKVKNGLDSLGIRYIVRTAVNGKDFNDDLIKDRGSFKDYINNAIYDAVEGKRKLAKSEKEQHLKMSNLNFIDDFVKNIEKNKNRLFLPTGFPSLDRLLDGGLHSGLYFVGAISSLGKTSFCLQVIDNVAALGNDCLVFSLEMAREELIAKSISRHTLLEVLNNNINLSYAKTIRGITIGSRYDSYSEKDKFIISESIKSYSKYADKIFIHEGVGDIGVERIRDEIEKHIRITGNNPIVLIDYLQILAPADVRGTDKQNIDKAVLELKRISRDFDIPVICISSFNRDNYMSPVNMASFKESGAVEYSSDVLLALQYDGMDWYEGESQRERESRVRNLVNDVVSRGKNCKEIKIQLKILKNRNGSRGEMFMDFYPMFNYFRDT